jgi:hydroxymethylbilane synthase
MTARLDPAFALAAVLKRHSPADAMIFRDDVAAKLEPPPVLSAEALRKLGKLKIGTGSLRRQALLKREAPELTTEGVRGNVDTRIRKLKEGSWDALILAEASLERLGIKDVKASRLDPEWFVPCASQGALALESRDDDPLRDWLRHLGHLETTAAVTIERQLLARLGGDCTMPFGCLVTTDGKAWTGRAIILSRDGDAAAARLVMPANLFNTQRFADELGRKLAAAGAGKILKKLSLPVPPEFA